MISPARSETPRRGCSPRRSRSGRPGPALRLQRRRSGHPCERAGQNPKVPGEEGKGATVLAKHTTVSEAAALRDDLRSYLVVIEHGEPVARHAIGVEALTVGRDPPGTSSSPMGRSRRLHLQVALAGGDVVVEDLGSSNGTYLDGRRLSAPSMLPGTDWVQLGHHLLKHERRSHREVEREFELQRDSEKARSYVQSLLPAPVHTGDVRVDWFHCPSAALGGDAFSYGPLDAHHLFAYLVDVSGHGVEAAMHSVSVLNVLRQRALLGGRLPRAGPGPRGPEPRVPDGGARRPLLHALVRRLLPPSTAEHPVRLRRPPPGLPLRARGASDGPPDPRADDRRGPRAAVHLRRDPGRARLAAVPLLRRRLRGHHPRRAAARPRRLPDVARRPRGWHVRARRSASTRQSRSEPGPDRSTTISRCSR